MSSEFEKLLNAQNKTISQIQNDQDWLEFIQNIDSINNKPLYHEHKSIKKNISLFTADLKLHEKYLTNLSLKEKDFLEITEPNLLKNIIKEKIYIENIIDLHGYNLKIAEQKFKSFITSSFEKNLKYLLVISGKGTAEQPGKIKHELTNSWLTDKDIIKLIASFSPASKKHGGAGAFYIILKKINL